MPTLARGVGGEHIGVDAGVAVCFAAGRVRPGAVVYQFDVGLLESWTQGLGLRPRSLAIWARGSTLVPANSTARAGGSG